MAVLELDLTLDDVVLQSAILGPRTLKLIQTLDPTVVAATAKVGRVANATLWLGEARTTSLVTLGEKPWPPVQAPALYNLTGPVRDSGGAILCFVGPPWKTVEWRMIQGVGTLTPYTTYTDAFGRASCRFDCGYVPRKSRVIVGVAYIP